MILSPSLGTSSSFSFVPHELLADEWIQCFWRCNHDMLDFHCSPRIRVSLSAPQGHTSHFTPLSSSPFAVLVHRPVFRSRCPPRCPLERMERRRRRSLLQFLSRYR